MLTYILLISRTIQCSTSSTFGCLLSRSLWPVALSLFRSFDRLVSLSLALVRLSINFLTFSTVSSLCSAVSGPVLVCFFSISSFLAFSFCLLARVCARALLCRDGILLSVNLSLSSRERTLSLAKSLALYSPFDSFSVNDKHSHILLVRV